MDYEELKVITKLLVYSLLGSLALGSAVALLAIGAQLAIDLLGG